MTDAEATDQAPRPSVMWAVALLPVLAAYANVFDVGFMWDDHVLIEENTDLHTLQAPWTYLSRTFWQHPFLYGNHTFYRPFVTFTLALDWAIGGGGPFVFHLTNLLSHLAVCTLVFVFAWRRSRSSLTAALVTMLFGVMPRLTESVTWIVGRTDVLATLMALLGLLAASSPRRGVQVLTGPFFLLALLSKEVALLGVCVLLAESALRFFRRERPLRDEVPALVSSVLAVIAWVVLRTAAQGGSRLGPNDPKSFLATLGHHVFLLLTPWQPNAQHGDYRDAEAWAVVLAVVTIGAVAVVAWRWLKSDQPWRAVWLGAALGGIVLVSVVRLPLYTIASDRFLYFTLAFGGVVAAQRAWGRAPLLVGFALTLALSVVTWRRNVLWGEPLLFWQEIAASASPKNVGAYAGLADALFEQSRFEEARALFAKAEEVRGPQRDSPSRLSLAVTDSRLGRDAEAIALLKKILEENPEWRRAHYDLVLFHARALDFASARAVLAQVRNRFGDDDVLRGFERMLAEQEPLVTSSDPLTRARSLHALGATRKAQMIYETLLAEPAARLEAAQWLVLFGSEATARKALELLPGDSAAEATWAERFPGK